MEPELAILVTHSWMSSLGLVLDRLNSCAKTRHNWGKDLVMRFQKGINFCNADLHRLCHFDDEKSLHKIRETKSALSKWLE